MMRRSRHGVARPAAVRVAVRIMAAALTLISGCASPFTAGVGSANGAEPGSVEITAAQIAPRSIAPTANLEPESYRATGIGPGGAVFSVESADPTVTVTGLAAGSWTVTMKGINTEDAVVLTWTGSVDVIANQPATIVAELAPPAGDGTLEVVVSWPSELVAAPEVTVYLEGDGVAVTELPATMDIAGTAHVTVSAPAGWYRLTVTLHDGSAVVAGATELAVVAADQTSTGSFSFDSLNKPGTPVALSGASFTLLWDRPLDDAGFPEPLSSYNVYYRPHGTYTWIGLGTADADPTPSFTVHTEILDYGTYDFAVTAVRLDGSESEPHTSLDDDADPQTGWYLVWSDA